MTLIGHARHEYKSVIYLNQMGPDYIFPIQFGCVILIFCSL